MIDCTVLRQIPLFANLSEAQLKFLKLGREQWVEPGSVLAVEGTSPNRFWLLLDGEVQCTKRMGDRQIPWMSFGPQSYFGHEQILLDQPCMTTARAMLKSYLLEFDTDAFWQMMECPAISRELLILTAQRTQALGTVSLQAEKLMSLGTLTSGLAQELRQVADTGRQSVEHLHSLFQWLQTLTVKLNAHSMTAAQQAFLLDLQQTLLERMSTLPVQRYPQSWRVQEDEIVAWLNDRQLPQFASCPSQQQLAKVLTRFGLDRSVLVQIAEIVPEESLCAVLGWLKSTLKSLALANEVESSTQRIASLVQIAKDYTYLDQAPLQEMDIHQGLENTLSVLRHRLEPSIEVVRQFDSSLPAICVYGSDLNQVWTHLIDNAIDAMNGQGCLTLRTSRVTMPQGDRVLVEVIDNGPGIAADIQPFIFDQFFTTKATANGTGLGLPIAYRVVVDQHRGHLHVQSTAGQTCFQVYLPMDLTDSTLALTSQVA
jgi:signal transduction histidine kinase